MNFGYKALNNLLSFKALLLGFLGSPSKGRFGVPRDPYGSLLIPVGFGIPREPFKMLFFRELYRGTLPGVFLQQGLPRGSPEAP